MRRNTRAAGDPPRFRPTSSIGWFRSMIFRSPFPAIVVPDVPLAEFLLGEATGRASKPALIDAETGRMLSYGQLAELVESLAGGLNAWFLDSLDTEVRGSATIARLGNAFLVLRSELGGDPAWDFVIGRSDPHEAYTVLYHDERGPVGCLA
jgi:hypothetical protein